MSDNPSDLPTIVEVRSLLHTIADLLRHAQHLGPEGQALLADLIDELGMALESPDVPNAEIATLAESAADLLQKAKAKEHPNVLEAAEGRLERAVVAVETGAPGLANLTRRLAEMLSDVGI
jgi:threonine aldolase